MEITKEQVQKMAQLSNLTLTDDELTKFSEYFTDTLEHINVLSELDTKDTLPTSQTTGLTNVYMKDGENTVTLTQEEALSTAPNPDSKMFGTNAVFKDR